MKLFRTSLPFLTLAAITALAACGGGGGGVTPSPGGGGGSTPPSASPTATPTPTPSPSQSPNIFPAGPGIGTSSTTVKAEINFVNGDYTWYTGGTASWSNHAGDTVKGASGNPMDGTSCGLMGEPGQTAYHVHAYVGLYVNGVWEAIPQAIGMKGPIEPTKGSPPQPSDTYEVQQAQCFYQIHTHDYSGIIHIEDPTKPQDLTYKTIQPYASLQTLFDLWGVPFNATTVASFSGVVSLYTGTSQMINGLDTVTSYTPFGGAAGDLKLAHHEAVWIVVGTPPVGGLPKVEFHVEN